MLYILEWNIEDLVKVCKQCLKAMSAPTVAPLYQRVWPTAPWKLIHIDFAGTFLGVMFLIIVDARSEWPEVVGIMTPPLQKQWRLFAYYFPSTA